MSPFVWKDGERQTTIAATVDLASPMWRLGQSLFETLRVYPRSERLYRVDDHVRRLFGSAVRMGWFDCPQPDVMKGWIRTAADAFRREHEGDGRLRLTVAWTKVDGPPDTFVTVSPYAPPTGPAVVVSTRIRLPDVGIRGAVKAGSRALYAQAERIAKESMADEALMLDRDGYPAEGTVSNLFIVREGHVVTPELRRGILPGVTRKSVMRLADAAGYPVSESVVPLSEIGYDTEVLLTNALWGPRIVGSIDRRAVRSDGPVGRHLQSLYAEDVAKEIGRA